MLHLLYSPVAKSVPELSIFLFSAQLKGDLDCLKAWRSVLCKVSDSFVQMALTCREKQAWNEWMNEWMQRCTEGLTATAKTEFDSRVKRRLT